MTYNIQYGKGRDGHYDVNRIADVLTQADIIGLQEVEAYWERSGNLHQVETIVERLARQGHNFFHIDGPTVDIHKAFPNAQGEQTVVRRQFGNAILSRWPILSARTYLFPDKLTPYNAHSIQRGVTEAVIDAPTGLLRVYTSHLSHLSEEERLEQARFILGLHRHAANNGPASSGNHPDQTWLEGPLPAVPQEAILMGDFNTLPESSVYTALTGPRHEHYGLLHTSEHFVDAWTVAAKPDQNGATLYTDWNARTGIRIDYIMVTPALASMIRCAEVLGDTDASDHQPLVVTLGD